jgi:hypothetical protein
MFAVAAESWAATLDLNKLGIAIAAMMRMMATTISNSISEKPFCLRICASPAFGKLETLPALDQGIRIMKDCIYAAKLGRALFWSS